MSDSVGTDILARDVSGRRYFFDEKIVSRHFNSVIIFYLVDQFFYMDDAHDALVSASGPNEAVEVPHDEVLEERDEGEVDEEVVADISDLRRISQRVASACNRLKYPC